MRPLLQCLCLSAAVFGASSALAQDWPDDPKAINLTANFQAQIGLDAGAQTADLAKAIAGLTQQLGDLANRECDVLSSTFNAECHVAQLNIGANVNERRFRSNLNDPATRPKMVSANMSATYALTPRAEAPKPSPGPAASPSPAQ